MEWSNLGYAGAFLLGTLVGVVTTIRLAKVIADFFKGQR